MRESGMKLIPFSDGVYEWKACMITRRDEEENEAVQCFRQHIQDWIGKIRRGEITR
jgi:DNA-binding transcriptional LysR family regulator